MRHILNYIAGGVTVVCVVSLAGCVPPGEVARPISPSQSFVRNLEPQNFGEARSEGLVSPTQQGGGKGSSEPLQHFATVSFDSPSGVPEVRYAHDSKTRASYRFVANERGTAEGNTGSASKEESSNDVVSNMYGELDSSALPEQESFQRSRSVSQNVRPYQGPLHLGEPGASSSLWRTQGAGGQLFRDHRAFQNMDIITIVVSESAEGSKEADTETSKQSTFLAGISEIFNFSGSLEEANPGLETATLLDASFDSSFTGEGETTRRGSLRATISAVVVEVLPNGVMRVEGEKVVSVNNEEQLIVISGLVRPRDVNSNNEVMSSKIAFLRVDYFGKGLVGDSQHIGWIGRLVNKLWPF